MLNATSEDFKSNKWISHEEIHAIRKGITNINRLGVSFENFEFLDTCYDFSDIFSFFYFSYWAQNNEDYYYNIPNDISNIFNPLLIYLMDNNYEVRIKKINISDTIDIIHSGLLSSMEAMENAYQVANYERVMSLSSSILESLFKGICDLNNISYKTSDSFPKLFRKVKAELKLHAGEYNDKPKLQKFSSIVNEIVLKLNELRNLYSESHGASNKDMLDFRNLEKHHIKLVLDSTKTIVNFLSDSYDYQYNSPPM